MNRKERYGRPRLVTTGQNIDLIEELICSQKETTHSYLEPCKIAEQTGISSSSIRRVVK